MSPVRSAPISSNSGRDALSDIMQPSKQGCHLKKLFFLLFLFSRTLFADNERWSIRAGYGYSDENDLGQILSMQPKPHYAGTSAGGVSLGYLLGEPDDGVFDVYLVGGINRFFENGYNPDFYEATLYVKLYWNMGFTGNAVRLGLGEGVSYAGGIPYVEWLEASKEHDNNSRILNYLDISLDVSIGRVIRYNPLNETYVGYALKHRSGIYGLINDVHRGGSNYNLFYIEQKF